MEKVSVTSQAGVGVIAMSDPATLNAADKAMLDGVSAALDTLAADDTIRCVVLTGVGRGFSSGANLAGGVGEGGLDTGAFLRETINPLMLKLRGYPKPLIAAVNGAAAGAGASLALGCDLIVAGESAFFLQAFRRIGLVPDGGATWMLPRMIGRARAMELALLGERLPARTAAEWGLINRCVPDAELMSAAMALAQALADGPVALGETRRLLWAGETEPDFAAQLDAEAASQTQAGRHPDFFEGVMAFREKRPAVFRKD